MTSSSAALDVTVGAFVAELARSGVRHVCVCPGSRSTPLAIKLAEHEAIKVWMHLDERSAAYFGLGLARALREPVGLLATSGTAAANFLPAIVEAFLGRVPLVVITADRPHELRDCGAPQTIDQLRLYGQHVKWFVDLPEPDVGLRPEQMRLVRTIAARAVGSAVGEPAGPVHVNWPFREPLMPGPLSPWERLDQGGEGSARQPAEPTTRGSWGARSGGRPYVDVSSGRRSPSIQQVTGLARDLADAPQGVIVCGPQDDPHLSPAAARLARQLGYPILADCLSGARCGEHDRSLVVDAYDAFLRDPSTVEQLEPQVILRLGAMPTSKSVLLYLQRYPAARHIVVDAGGWREPTGLASDMLDVDARLLCEALADAVPASPSNAWAPRWLAIDTIARQSIGRYLSRVDELFEARVFSDLPSLLPDDANLYVGNSMPVRDLDTFFPSTSRRWRFLSNRGANGIDGVVSSALGASAADAGQVVLVIGDISFYHDLNGLLAARTHGLNTLVIVLNNDGGGIFSFLPQAELDHDRFETLFGTPHGLDFRPFVEGYGGRFVRVDDWRSFDAAVADGLVRGGLQVVEVPTERSRNVILHRQVWRAVSEALALAPVH